MACSETETCLLHLAASALAGLAVQRQAALPEQVPPGALAHRWLHDQQVKFRAEQGTGCALEGQGLS